MLVTCRVALVTVTGPVKLLALLVSSQAPRWPPLAPLTARLSPPWAPPSLMRPLMRLTELLSLRLPAVPARLSVMVPLVAPPWMSPWISSL